jgi:hypothetical protein
LSHHRPKSGLFLRSFIFFNMNEIGSKGIHRRPPAVSGHALACRSQFFWQRRIPKGLRPWRGQGQDERLRGCPQASALIFLGATIRGSILELVQPGRYPSLAIGLDLASPRSPPRGSEGVGATNNPHIQKGKAGTMNTERNDVYSRVTNQIVKAIEAGAGEWRMPWHHSGADRHFPRNAGTELAYRGINILTLWAAADEK